MTDLELDRIEAAVGFALPAAYRRAASATPFRPIGRDCVYWFFDDPASVVSETLAPLSDGGFDPGGLPPGLLAVGRSAVGDLYLLDTRDEALQVFTLTHDSLELVREWPSFDAFVSDWVEYSSVASERLEAERLRAEEEWRKRRRLGWWIIFVSIGLPLAAFLVLSAIR
ncbi:MAG: hypothetical protein SFX72_18870 [Isosphaeraceae bacterium]|nr:hypothetical protein [Isosphaeraceae bacterium]